jgi:hypothetical protein
MNDNPLPVLGPHGYAVPCRHDQDVNNHPSAKSRTGVERPDPMRMRTGHHLSWKNCFCWCSNMSLHIRDWSISLTATFLPRYPETNATVAYMVRIRGKGKVSIFGEKTSTCRPWQTGFLGTKAGLSHKIRKKARHPAFVPPRAKRQNPS